MSEDTERNRSGSDETDGPSSLADLTSSSRRVSRRAALGLGGLVAAGGLFGPGLLTSQSTGTRELDGDLACNGHDLLGVGGLSGPVTDGQRLESLAGRNISIDDGRLNAATGAVSDELETRLDDAITRLEVVGGTANTWRAGPTSPTGGYHRNGAFGLLFETDRPAYLGECTIDADSAGRFTPLLYEYDGDADALGARVDSLTVRTTGGPQTVFLDFLVDEPGTYLLTRAIPTEAPADAAAPDSLYRPSDDPVELRRSDAYGSGFADDSRDGVTFEGGYNPYVTDDPVEYYYYYFDLELSSARS